MTDKPEWSASRRAFSAMAAELREDIDRYVYMDQRHWLVSAILQPGIGVMMQYRCSRWVHYYCHIPGLRPILKVICSFWQKFIEILTGVEIPNRAEIGGGLFMPHANGIIVHMDAKIGRNCNLGQQVTIGVGGRLTESGIPVIGDRVFVGPGAKLFGAITIGQDVAIGANAVVTKDLPNCAVAVGVPAKVISHDGSRDYISYRGADQLPLIHTSEEAFGSTTKILEAIGI
jgi:serine O-acetyltransferase